MKAFDPAFLLWVQNNLRNPVLTQIMKFFTFLGDHGLIWIAISFLLLCFQKTRRTGEICLAALLFEYMIASFILKPLFARPRPYDIVPGLVRAIRKQKDFSFPSGHAGSAFACAVVLFKKTPKKYGISAIVLALVISFSRIYLGVHYPSDILAGIFLGTAVALIVCRAEFFLQTEALRKQNGGTL